MDFAQVAQVIVVMALPLLLAITMHEAAHAYVAHYLGDPTAHMLGRITLNPLKHIDPIGTVVMPLALYFVTNGSFMFGYAKPVPINARNLRNPRQDMVWIALAGPVSNFAQAIIWTIVLSLLFLFQIPEAFFKEMAHYGILINLVLAVLNLFPLPPLDGGRIAVGLLPNRFALFLQKIEPFGFFIIIGLLMVGILDRFWLSPLITAINLSIIQPLIRLFM